MVHLAASRNDLEIVDLLVQSGANLSIEDKYKFNAYGLALRDE